MNVRFRGEAGHSTPDRFPPGRSALGARSQSCQKSLKLVKELPPVAPETYVVRRRVFVAPPPVVVEEYSVHASPQVYAAPKVYAAPLYAYAGPGWRGGWGHRGHFRGHW